MSAIATKTNADLEKAYDFLCKALNNPKLGGQEAHRRINAHLRVSLGRPVSLGVYHIDAGISDTDKFATYKLCFNSIAMRDYAKLQGQQGAGDKRIDPLAETPEPEKPSRPVAQPEPEPEKPNMTLTPRSIKPAEATAAPSADELTQAIIRHIAPHLTAKAGVDPKEVEGIARSVLAEWGVEFETGLHDRIKKAVGNGAFPEDRVKKLLDEYTAGMVKRIELVTPAGETKAITGLVHRQFETILKMTRSRTANGYSVPVWLDGPPGGGKSHLMEQLAEALGIEPYILSIGPTDTKTIIIGSIATGEFKPGIAYKPFKEGGLLGIDEVAAGDPGVLVSLNTMSANNRYRFPNGELVTKHKDFHLIAADNTRGHGNVKGMIRNRLDAATLDRFAFLKVDYDEQMESALCGNPAWAAYVKKVRDYIASNSSETVYITPRASINGAALLAGGLSVVEAADATVFKFTSKDIKQTIIANIGEYQP